MRLLLSKVLHLLLVLYMVSTKMKTISILMFVLPLVLGQLPILSLVLKTPQLLRLVQLKIDSILLILKVISLMTFRSKVILVERLHNPLDSLRIRQQFFLTLVVLSELIQRHYSELSRKTLLYIQRVPDNISMLSNMMVSMLKLVRESHLLVM